MVVCLLITISPHERDYRLAINLADEMLKRNISVKVFLMIDGVLCIGDKMLDSIIKNGAEVIVCSQNAKERGIKSYGRVKEGSQYELSQIINRVDRFLAFT